MGEIWGHRVVALGLSLTNIDDNNICLRKYYIRITTLYATVSMQIFIKAEIEKKVKSGSEGSQFPKD